ncbi:MAG: carboxypeptidase regulatory-like domain-containing protein [Bryobacteraceae bacterium]
MRIDGLRYAALAWLAVSGLAAAEHHGQVNFNGLPVPGATVTAVQADKKFVAVTDQQGAYSFADLADGVWTIQVEMLCFAPIKQEVAVASDAPSPVWELKVLPLEQMHASAMQPAAVQQAAAVAGAQPAKPAKKAANPKSATAASNPQAGFQRTDVNAAGEGAAQGGLGAEMGNEGGAAGDLNQTASDAMVVSGSSSGAIERRAIGNARQGPGSMYQRDLSLILDNSALDARPYSLTGQNTEKPAYDHLRAGASFGGPLLIPHLLPGQGQFFVNYQATRNRNDSTNSTLMPTQAMRSGDLSQAISDPNTGQPFPGNAIPASRTAPQSTALLKFYPLPNFPDSAGYNYQIPLVGISHQDDVQGRANKMLNRKHFVNGSFAYRNARSSGPNVFGFDDTGNTTGFNANANWRYMASQRLNFSLGYQFSRMTMRTTPYFANRQNVSGEAGITGNNQEPGNWGPPNLSFSSGIAGLSDAALSLTRNQTSGVSFTGFWMRRPHNITFGADFRRQQFNLLGQQNARGNFTFTGAATGSDFADFLLGVPDTSAIAFGNADKYFRAVSYDAYFTDDWRVSPGLTINAGARWEYNSPIAEKYGRLVNLDVAPGFAAEAPVEGSNPTGPLTGRRYPTSLVQPDKHAWQPRVGLSWRPFFGTSTLVRAGYGLYYNTSIYQPIATMMAQQSPLSKSLSVQNSPANPLTLANGFNASPSTTTNTFAIDPNFRAGYSHNWSLSVQQDLAGSMVMTATYLGIKGTRAAQVFLPNTFPAGAVNPCPACPAGYAYMTSNGNSTREAGLVQLRRRLHNGFTASLQYTFAKAIDNAALGGRGQGSQVIAQNWLNLDAERGLSNFDQRHQATAQVQYTTGIGVGGGTLLRGWEGAAFKGWTFIANITAGSGMPLTPVYVAAVRNTGVTGSIRPDYTGAPVYAAPAGRFLNPAAYAAAAAGLWGNAGRNSITGPDQFALNASMGRSFGDVDLRFDSTNALNHVTFPSWNTSVNSAQFGLPNAANAMRSVQATLRWRF